MEVKKYIEKYQVDLYDEDWCKHLGHYGVLKSGRNYILKWHGFFRGKHRDVSLLSESGVDEVAGWLIENGSLELEIEV